MKKIILLLVFFLNVNLSISQDNIHQLKQELDRSNPPKTQIELLNKIALYYKKSLPDSALIFINQALKIAKKHENKRFLAQCYMNKAVILDIKGNYPEAIDNARQAIDLFHPKKDKQGLANTYFIIGRSYYNKAESEENIEINDFYEAENYYRKSRKMASEIGDTLLLTKNWIEVGLIKFHLKEVEKAERLLQLSLEISRKKQNQHTDYIHNVAKASNNLGMIYKSQQKWDKAKLHFSKAMDVDSVLNTKDGVAAIRLAEIYLETGELNQGLALAHAAMDTAEKYNFIVRHMQATDLLQKLYATQGNYSQAYKYSQEYNKQTENLNKFSTEFKALEKKYAIEKQRRIDERRDLLNKIYLGGFFFMLILAAVLYRSFFMKKKANKLLRKKNKKILQQKEEITDSIKYALRIQTAILPECEKLEKMVSDYFVLYKPRDIVSGDFYWISEQDNKMVIIAADCTGHGVPGALMSMLGISLLTEIVNKYHITEPAEILNLLREKIIHLLKQRDASNHQNDGMDIAVITYEPEQKVIKYSGAYNPLYLVKNEDFKELKANKMPVAIHLRMKDFTQKQTKVQKGDKIYIFSDGYKDQFGGPKGEKFKAKNFKKLLIQNRHLPMQMQKNILNEKFETWKSHMKQIDDVLVVGLNI